MMPKVRLVNIHHGSEHRSHIIFAKMTSENGDIEVGGTLEFLLQLIQERGYVLVGDPK